MSWLESEQWALQFGLLSSGDMNLTTVENPQGTETFTSSDMVIGLSFARMLTDRFSAGLTAKYVRETWDDVSAGGVAIDIGTLYDTGFKTLRIGMSIQNFGPELTPGGEGSTWNNGFRLTYVLLSILNANEFQNWPCYGCNRSGTQSFGC